MARANVGLTRFRSPARPQKRPLMRVFGAGLVGSAPAGGTRYAIAEVIAVDPDTKGAAGRADSRTRRSLCAANPSRPTARHAFSRCGNSRIARRGNREPEMGHHPPRSGCGGQPPLPARSIPPACRLRRAGTVEAFAGGSAATAVSNTATLTSGHPIKAATSIAGIGRAAMPSAIVSATSGSMRPVDLRLDNFLLPAASTSTLALLAAIVSTG